VDKGGHRLVAREHEREGYQHQEHSADREILLGCPEASSALGYRGFLPQCRKRNLGHESGIEHLRADILASLPAIGADV